MVAITYECPNCHQHSGHANNCPSYYEQPRTTPPASGAGSEQSRLFPRYSFAVVTGRYKILDNRAEGTPKFPQIATADGEEEARAIVQALNAAEQHSTLIEQREQLRAILSMTICNGCGNRIGFNEWPTRYGDWRNCSSCREAREVLTTIEQEGERRG